MAKAVNTTLMTLLHASFTDDNPQQDGEESWCFFKRGLAQRLENNKDDIFLFKHPLVQQSMGTTFLLCNMLATNAETKKTKTKNNNNKLTCRSATKNILAVLLQSSRES